MLRLSVCLLASALGQVPADDAKELDAIPPGADVVIRTRGLEQGRGDLVAMLRAMSPALAAGAEPPIEFMMAQFRKEFETALDRPATVFLRAVAGDQPAAGPPFLVVLRDPDYEAFVKRLAAKPDIAIKHEPGGFDSFVNEGGQTWFAAKGGEAGTVAFGQDRTLMAAYLKPIGGSGAKRISPAQRGKLVGGDIGVWVDLAALASRYAGPIEQGRAAMMAGLDQAGQQPASSPAMMEMVKSMYGGMFDSFKFADSLAFHLDFSAEGLAVAGELTVKPDNDLARSIAAAKSSDAAGLAKIPAGAAYYMAMDLDGKDYDRLQNLGLKMMAPSAKPSPEQDAAGAKLRSLGRVETLGSSTMDNGMKMFNVVNLSDPKALLASTESMAKAFHGGEGALSFVKESTFTPDAGRHRGFAFVRSDVTLDLDKLAQAQAGAPGGAANVAAMYGSGRTTTWTGVDDRRMIQVIEPDWAKVKALVDAYLDGTNPVGSSAGFRATRAKLADRANGLMLMDVRGLVRQVAAQFAAFGRGIEAKPAGEVAADPVFVGASLTLSAPGSAEFRLVVPGAVGPVVEKDLVPIFRALQPPAPVAPPGARVIQPPAPVAPPVAAPPRRIPQP